MTYRARINPVCTLPGQGTVLFGDKTGLHHLQIQVESMSEGYSLFLKVERKIATL